MNKVLKTAKRVVEFFHEAFLQKTHLKRDAIIISLTIIAAVIF